MEGIQEIKSDAHDIIMLWKLSIQVLNTEENYLSTITEAEC